MICGALRLTVREFAKMCRLDKMTVSELERGIRRVHSGTQEKIREAFTPYVEFIEPIEGVRGAGIIMKWGVEPIGDTNDGDDERNTSKYGDDGFHSRAWDDDFDNVNFDESSLSDDERQWLHYVRTNPKLSERGREILLKTIRI